MSVGGVLVAGPSLTTDARALTEQGVSIQQNIDGTPDTAQFSLYLAAPGKGDDVLIGLGGLTGSNLIFGGVVLSVSQEHPTEQSTLVLNHVSAIGYEWLLDHRLVNRKYTGQSATDIVEDLMDSFTTGFTYAGLEASLATIDEISFTNEPVSHCLDRIVKRIGGNWVMSPEKDLQLGLDILTGGVSDISTADSATASRIGFQSDLSQVRTRVYMEGNGSTCGAELAAGSTVLPVHDASYYSASGGKVAVGPQRVVYASKVDGLGGALVGTSVTPASAVTVAAAGGSGVTAGAHKYKHTYVTGAGETLPGPESATVTTGNQIAAPSTAPSGAKSLGGNLSAGVYSWKVTYYDSAGGETTPSSASSNVTMDDVSAPSNAPAAQMVSGDADMAVDFYQYKYTFKNGGFETLPSPTHTPSIGISDSATQRIRIARSGLSSPPAGAGEIQFYRADFTGGMEPWKRMNGPSDGMGSDDANYYYETTETGPAGTLGPDAPSSNTMIYRRATVTIPVSSDPGTVGRKVYRTAAGGGTWKLVGTVANNTQTSFDDNVADGSLGANAPSSNTATLSRVSVSGISAGPSGTTSRKLYRTVAAGSTFKLLATIADNTTTTYTDSTADGSLGADAPGSDTSGLVQESGNVTAGSTSLFVTSSVAFESAGGWAYVGSLPILYTGKSASSLTGIPASGDGSISTALRYGAVIVAAPMLTGIAGSGDGSIAYAIPIGEPVNLVATADDVDAQSLLASYVGGDGIKEEYLQDNRLSLDEAQNRAEARLQEVGLALDTFRYRTRDTTTRAGKTVSVSLDELGISSILATYRIQRVRASFPVASGGEVVPFFEVEASSRLFTFEQLLRVISGKAA